MIIVTDNGPVDIGEAVEVPASSAPRNQRLGFTWVGHTGDEWDLVYGPVGLLSGARGFGLPRPQHWRRENLLDGAFHTGLRFPARDVFLPVEIRDRQAILEQERPFFTSLDPRREARLRVTTPDAQWRELVVRYDEGAEGEYEWDPLVRGATAYGLRMTAEDPFWRGSPVVVRSEYPSATPSFFTGPPFRLAPVEVLGNTEVTNPGDVDAYATWRIEGPFSGFSVGIGTALVTMTLAKPPGGWVEIDMSPAAKTIRDEAGANLWSVADDVSMAPLPPGEVQVATTVTGASAGSAVQVSFTPRYFRAW